LVFFVLSGVGYEVVGKNQEYGKHAGGDDGEQADFGAGG
jgi:hypothetical protein